MKVKDLIQILQECSPDSEVIYSGLMIINYGDSKDNLDAAKIIKHDKHNP